LVVHATCYADGNLSVAVVNTNRQETDTLYSEIPLMNLEQLHPDFAEAFLVSLADTKKIWQDLPGATGRLLHSAQLVIQSGWNLRYRWL